MSYLTKITEPGKIIVDIIIMEIDYCTHVYGESPCSATDQVKCYNTFHTCKSQIDFIPIKKEYNFITADLPAYVINDFPGFRPYIRSINDLATEIKETDTVTKRLKVQLFDDKDNDVGIDPYIEERTRPSASFWRKFLARNKNYAGRIIIHKRGTANLPLNEFKTVFVGKIENISLNRGVAEVVAVDLLKEMSKIDYPIRTDIQTVTTLGAVYTVSSEDDMLNLTKALPGDFALRTDFLAFPFFSVALVNTTGNIPIGGHRFSVVAYNNLNEPISKTANFYLLVNFPNRSIEIWWQAVSGAVKYELFYGQDGIVPNPEVNMNRIIGTFTIPPGQFTPLILGEINIIEEKVMPREAARYFRLTGEDPALIGSWTPVTNVNLFQVAVTGDTSEIVSPGYIRINKEIIYYELFAARRFQNIRRGQFNTEAVRQPRSSGIEVLFNFIEPANPFFILKKILSIIKVDQYIGSKFDEYEASWTGPQVTLLPIIKDTKLNKIFFDLVTALDCICWVNEEGNITILKHDEMPETIPAINDEINFIKDSISLDYNDESRSTRWILHWDRVNLEESIEDRTAYNRITVTIDNVSESAKNYNDKIEDVQYCVWFNSNGINDEQLTDYVNDLLDKRRIRTKEAQALLTAELEIKDDMLTTGDLVNVNSEEILNENGARETQLFRIIKKENTEFNKFKLTLKRKFYYEQADSPHIVDAELA